MNRRFAVYLTCIALLGLFGLWRLAGGSVAPEGGGGRPDDGPSDRPALEGPNLHGMADASPPDSESVEALPSTESDESALRVSVVSSAGPVDGVVVSARWRRSRGSEFVVETATSDSRGIAQFPGASGRVVVTARHESLGAAGVLAWAPGNLEVQLERGPEVVIDAGAIPDRVRASLSIVSVGTDTYESPEHISLASGSASLGVRPVGLLVVAVAGPSGGVARYSFLLPDKASVVCPLTLGERQVVPTPRCPRVQDWNLSYWDEQDGVLKTLRASPSGTISFPLGLPECLCRADADGSSRVVFVPARLREEQNGVRVVPRDVGCKLTLDLGASDLPPLALFLLQYTRAELPELPAGSPVRDRSTVNVSGSASDPVARLAEFPSSSGRRVTVRVPSHALLGLFGEEGGHRVRLTIQTEAPGTSTELRVASEECATLDLRGGSDLAGAEVVLVERATGRLQLRGPVHARLSQLGSAVLSGIPVPFSGSVRVSSGGRLWTSPVDLDVADRVRLEVVAMRREPEHQYRIQASVDGQPADGAMVTWVGGGGAELLSRTDSSGIATISSSARLFLASVSMGEDLSGMAGGLEANVIASVALEHSLRVRVAVGSRHEGSWRSIEFVPAGGSSAIYKKRLLVLGAASFEPPALPVGDYTIRLLDDSGSELDRRSVSPPETGVVQIDFR